jgi:hypothetical protein
MPPDPARLPGSRRHAHHARRQLLLAAGAAVLLAACPAVRADTIAVDSAELRVDDDEVLLNAQFGLTLNATLEEALQRGVPLYFVLEAEVTRPRWYWLDEKVLRWQTQYRVSWLPLTRQYRVASGLLSQTFDTLDEVERLIGRVNSRAIARLADLERGARYDVTVRLRLDVNQMPKPFQVGALGSREWQLASEPRRLSFVP